MPASQFLVVAEEPDFLGPQKDQPKIVLSLKKDAEVIRRNSFNQKKNSLQIHFSNLTSMIEDY